MTREDIENVLKDNKLSKRTLTASEMVNLISYVTPHLEMNRTNMEYYYRIPIKDLIESNMPIDDLDDLRNEGWSFDESRDNLILIF